MNYKTLKYEKVLLYRFYAGDLQGAQRASDEAKKWTKIGFIVSIVMTVLYVLLMILGVVGSIFNYGN
ncbi:MULTISPECIES: CD225/dispanin family protein [Sphingobacterium]|uniref:CD225/dispanin family protein n=1 Tax=unclassified Sphingobacterium TaxID=2609468 RepID=UPI00104C6A6C|nr:hypothetical protein [Sphingobacterium sp. B16(2022)]